MGTLHHRIACALGGVAIAALCGAAEPALPPPLSEDGPLNSVQARIAALRTWPDAELGTGAGRIGSLLEDYLIAFAPHLEPGGLLDLLRPDGPPDGRESARASAFDRRVQDDLGHWHPLVGLVFADRILDYGPRALYAVMFGRGMRGIETAIAERKRLRTLLELQSTPDQVTAIRIAEEAIESEIADLWSMVTAMLGQQMVSILDRGLTHEWRGGRPDLVDRAVRITERVFTDPLCKEIATALREYDKSAALSSSIFDAAMRRVANRKLLSEVRWLKFAQLTHMLVLLQTVEAKDYLLLFYDRLESGREPEQAKEDESFERFLIEATTHFVHRSIERDREHVLALETVDQLTQWIVTRLRLVYPELVWASVVRAMLAIHEMQPTILEEYVVRFHRDFHALNPAGYENVIFHLVAIVVEYARNGQFLGPDPNRPRPLGPERPIQDRVMALLTGYNWALERVADDLPEIDLDFVDREQVAVVETIFEFFDLRMGETGRNYIHEDPRLTATMLPLLARIARVWEPDEIRQRILAPFERLVALELDPLNSGKRTVTPAMFEVMTALRRLVCPYQDFSLDSLACSRNSRFGWR